MKKVIVIGAILMLAAMANAIYTPKIDSIQQTSKNLSSSLIPRNEIIAANAVGNVLVSGEDDDMHPSVSRDSSGHILISYATQHSIFEQDVTLIYSTDGSTWTAANTFISNDGGILQYPVVVGIQEANDFGIAYMDPLSEYPLTVWRATDVTNPDTYNGISISWGETEDYQEVAATFIHDLFFTFINLHNFYTWDIEGCPYIAYWTPTVEQPTEIGGTYFDGQSILQTAPASNLDTVSGSDYFYLVMEHWNDTTGHSEIAFKKSVTDKTLLYTSGGGPGGMDKYADIEAMPWQQYLAKGDFDAKDPNIAASGNNVAVVYMSNDNIYGDYNIDCWYSNDGGETWQVSTPAGTPQIDETYPALFMAGSTVYCVYVKTGNLYLVESEDGGATWGEPSQINEVDGTVVEEHRTVEISDGGIVWTDTRNGGKDIYYAPLPIAILELNIAGGFGVTVTVTNTGTAEATDLAWSVELSGPVFVGKVTEGAITSLPPGTSQTVGPGLVLGIGPTTITATAGGASKTASGFVLGPLVLGL